MDIIEILKSIRSVSSKIDRHIFNEKIVPNELILEHNKLVNDYNEQLKIKNNGK